MMTAEEVIVIIRELPPEEQEKVADYLNAGEEEYVEEENYSPEDMAKIDHDLEEAKRGINVSPTLRGKEAVAYLRQFRKA